MRVSAKDNDLVTLAIAGSNVVVLGWDLPEEDIRGNGVLGFAIQRTRASDGDRRWLGGFKTFEAIDPHPAPGEPVRSFEHPIQSFQWSDYSVAPGKTYTYRVVAMAGLPGAMNPIRAAEMTVTTESASQGTHSVFFNRGAIASQEYARRFQNRPPDEVGQAAFDWLSRGLVEALEAFIAGAGAGDELLGAIFEFRNDRIFAALRAAQARGARVTVLYDADSAGPGNEEAIEQAGLADLTKPRENSGGFAHNKFFVLVRGGVPAEVWTGSTNLSKNGLFGHSNNAHVVRDPAVAAQFVEAWRVLDADRTLKPTATEFTERFPAPPNPFGPLSVVFSPRRDLEVLDWYADLARNAQRGLFATFAFGMNERFVDIYDRSDSVLRYALMEKEGNGKQFKKQAAEIKRIRMRPNTVIAIGNNIKINAFDRWLAEIDQVDDNVHVRFVHTKYMLIDPLGDDPVVIVGSANFSKASTDTNDENMLVIRGDKAVADIYLGEFMRLFSHYAFRETLKFRPISSPVEALKRKYLIPGPEWIDGDKPSNGYFRPGTDRSLRRLYFSGQ